MRNENFVLLVSTVKLENFFFVEVVRPRQEKMKGKWMSWRLYILDSIWLCWFKAHFLMFWKCFWNIALIPFYLMLLLYRLINCWSRHFLFWHLMSSWHVELSWRLWEKLLITYNDIKLHKKIKKIVHLYFWNKITIWDETHTWNQN